MIRLIGGAGNCVSMNPESMPVWFEEPNPSTLRLLEPIKPQS
jgi:hypothetical protein